VIDVNNMEKKSVKKALYRIFTECGIFGSYAIVIPAYGPNAVEIATFDGSEHHPIPTEDLWKIFHRFYLEELIKEESEK